MGCALQVGEQAVNVGRCAALAAGFPETVAGTTIDRQCGSSQQAAHFAAQGVMAGAYDVVIAAGVESMTRVPLGSSVKNGPGRAFGPRMIARYDAAGGLVNQGVSAEMIADKWNLTREVFVRDEGIRADCDIDTLAKLKPAWRTRRSSNGSGSDVGSSSLRRSLRAQQLR